MNTYNKQAKHMSNVRNLLSSTVTSRLFTHIMSTEKMRKDTRYRKDRRGTNILTITAVFKKIASN